MKMTGASTRRRLEATLSTIGHTGATSRQRIRGAAAALFLAPAAVQAADPLSNLPFNLAGGAPNLDVRLRYEHVKTDGPLAAPITEDEADAFTARARLGYTTGKWNELDGQLEFEGLTVIGDDDFNSGKNGETTYPVVADAKFNEVNQAWLRYSGLPKTQIKYGRQRIVLDNQRFVGNVGWRQNEMTYDATQLTTTIIPRTTFTYAYLTNVNSFKYFNFAPMGVTPDLDDNLDIEAHLINAQVAVLDKRLVVTAYGYLLDFDEIPPGAATARLFADSKTFGARVMGAIPVQKFTLGYALEYADQQDYEDSTSVVDADYSLIEASLGYGKFKGTVGFEVLEGDGTTYSFQTPLSTAHAHQGWADQFLITPVGGLERTFVSASATIGKVGLTATYHSFEAQTGGLDYGDEIDLLASCTVIENVVLYAKYASYSADELPTAGTPAQPFDTEKVWVYAEYKF